MWLKQKTSKNIKINDFQLNYVFCWCNYIKNKWFDVVITTCGALDHDVARYFSNYKEGSFTLDDKKLAAQKIHRLGNILVPFKSYGPLFEE